ncbi:hypothetical protein KR044_003893 [Drosophila immigrans]|nr:hypothetical protein KR044_003893 [Drosophila immigrans]
MELTAARNKLNITYLFQQAKKMLFNNGRCTFNRNFFSNFSLRIPNGKIYLDMLLVKPLHVGLRGHLSFEYRTSKAKSFQSVFQLDLDYCSVLKATNNALVRRWYLSMMKLSNYSTSCPIPPASYYMHGWKSDGNLVPPFLTMGDYRIAGTFYYGKFREHDDNPILRCTVQAQLVG